MHGLFNIITNNTSDTIGKIKLFSTESGCDGFVGAVHSLQDRNNMFSLL